MSDHDQPDDPADPADAAVGALLAVPPLDDVTRRRLVRTALDAADDPPVSPAAPRRRSRLAVALPVAAAIAIGVVVGAVVVTRPEESTPTAARPGPSTEVQAPAPRQASASSDGDAAGAPSVVPVVRDLGDLGDVTTTEQLRIAVGAARPGSAAKTGAVPAVPCAETPATSLGLLAIDAVGQGVDGTTTVTVFVGPDTRGVETAVVVTAPRCEAVARAEV
jgi:hypothetical protein